MHLTLCSTNWHKNQIVFVILHVFLHVFVFLSCPGFFNAIFREIFFPIMDKKTLIRLAQPAATTLLALSIFTLPFIVKASGITTVYQGDRYWKIRNY